MNRPENPVALLPIPDVQSGSDERQIDIDHVGIKGLRYPLPFVDQDGVAHTTIAICNVYVALPAERKGTHMSRLVALLEERAAPEASPISVAGLRDLVEDLTARLDAPGARIELAFPFFVRKVAPVSGVASLLDYDVRLAAELADGRYSHTLTVAVPVTSLCPSSKEIAEYGADEKYVTERAYDNPRFVEDLVRGVAARLAVDARVDGFSVEAENFESIHNHSAYARVARNF